MTYGLVGEKLGHSYSKVIHEKLKAYDYELFPLSEDEVIEFVKSRDFEGLNVTIPYKQTVMPYCDLISPLAEEIGAVNTLYFDKERRLCGTNTDYHGFIYAMEDGAIPIYDKKVLILGDGATCKTLRKAVLDMGANEIVIASRRVEAPVFEHFQRDTTTAPFERINCTTINYLDLDAQPDVQVIINATPVGMFPNIQGTPVDLSRFPKCIGVFDVVYNPYYTQFILQAKDLGIPYASGLSMLVAQATAAAGYFTGGKDFSDKNSEIISCLKEEMVCS